MTRELNIICQVCEKPIDNDQGGLWLGAADLSTRQHQHAKWEAASAGKSISVLRHPPRAHWQAHHHDCDTTGTSDAYSIQSEKLQTWADLVSWTAHLMEKEWLADTDWVALLAGAAEGDGSRIVPVAKPQLNA